MESDENTDTALMTKAEIARLLAASGTEEMNRLFHWAREVKKTYVGAKVYYRGIIEISNICGKDCYYCGIRKSNRFVDRYMMSEEEILRAALQAYRWGYGSVVIQAGEVKADNFITYIERIIGEISRLSNGELGITLSLGEQTEETYRRWREAGAHRYLLRIETSDRGLYGTLHPSGHSFDRRLECLRLLKDTGYQVGTGVMIGLPGQTIDHLADDIRFFRDIDADMIGMGPFIPHRDTPFSDDGECFENDRESRLELALRMIAVTRIVLKDVNIASTTALQALDESGRELGLRVGANVIMPNMTDMKYRGSYRLYDRKPCLDENSEQYRSCLDDRIHSIGETVGYGMRGDSPHYFKRQNG